jgi:hypothetical protein
MKRMTSAKVFVLSCAVAVGATACNSTNSANADRNAATRADHPADDTTAHDAARDATRDMRDTDRNANGAKQTPITVTGCLQQGDGHSYILTRINEPSQKSVGTSGQEGAVQREQMRAAANSYRIDPSGDVKMDDMVGKQAKVSGTLAEQADLPKDTNRDELKIKEGDIAKIDAATVSMVANNCK